MLNRHYNLEIRLMEVRLRTRRINFCRWANKRQSSALVVLRPLKLLEVEMTMRFRISSCVFLKAFHSSRLRV